MPERDAGLFERAEEVELPRDIAVLLEGGGDVGEDVEVVADLIAHVRPLHFDHYFAAVAQHAAVDLPERRGGHRRRLERLEQLRDARAELLLHDRLDLGVRERLDVVLQRLERGDVLGRDDVGTGGDHLPEFHVGRAHLLETVGKRLGPTLDVWLDLAVALVEGHQVVRLEREMEVLAPVAGEQNEQIAIGADVTGLEHRRAQVQGGCPLPVAGCQ